MTKEWVEQKERERRANHGKIRKRIFDRLTEVGFTKEEAELVKKDIVENMKSRFFSAIYLGKNMAKLIKEAPDEEKRRRLVDAYDELRMLSYKDVEDLRSNTYSFIRYQDSEPMEFDGDIIITDPCYILNHDPAHYDNDWEKCFWGENLEELGIVHAISRDTIFGDWSCSVYNTKTRRKMGEFCADSGMVAVMDLKEVLAYNPSFDYHKKRKWTTTLIPNFKGTVQFVVKEEPYKHNGKEYIDYEVKVVGRGINKRSKKPLEFIGTQTGI